MDSRKKGDLGEVSKNTQIDLLAFLTEPKNAENQAQWESFIQENPERSLKELNAWHDFIQDLKKSPLPEPDQAFFLQQKTDILEKIKEEAEWGPMGDLISELEELSEFDKPFDDVFFAQQAKKIKASLLNEHKNAEKTAQLLDQLEQNRSQNLEDQEAISLKECVGLLKSLDQKDPGDLFFRRQRNKILQHLPVTKKSKTKVWLPLGAFAVAAMLILVIGINKITINPQKNNHFKRFSKALLQPFEGIKRNARVEFVDLDDLDTHQLDRLANRLSERVWEGVGDEWVEPSSDWEDLSPQEMGKLIHKLESRLKT